MLKHQELFRLFKNLDQLFIALVKLLLLWFYVN